MKVFVAIACMVAVSMAEPPPSNSYLPPSSRAAHGGYPSGGAGAGGLPQVVAARSQGFGGHGHGANGFARNSGRGGHGGHGGHGGAQGRNGGNGYDQGSQGYDHNAAAFGRNALDSSGEPAHYNFGYMVNDYHEGTDFGHHEERQDDSAHGEYHVVLPDGRKQTVSYEADERGFKPHISYEDTGASARSGGYDSNANDHHGSQGGHGFNGARSSGYN